VEGEGQWMEKGNSGAGDLTGAVFLRGRIKGHVLRRMKNPLHYALNKSDSQLIEG
jgi:hypothetical protein